MEFLFPSLLLPSLVTQKKLAGYFARWMVTMVVHFDSLSNLLRCQIQDQVEAMLANPQSKHFAIPVTSRVSLHVQIIKAQEKLALIAQTANTNPMPHISALMVFFLFLVVSSQFAVCVCVCTFVCVCVCV